MLTSRRCPYLPEVLALLLLPVLALAVAPAAPGGEAVAQVPVSGTAPVGVAAEPPAHLESAIARVRSLYFGRDFHHGAAEGDAALAHWPESGELAMWTVANIAGPSVGRMAGASRLQSEMATAAAEAVARAESLVAAQPDDVWAAMALALALTHHEERRGEALDASLRPLGLAPTLPEAVWVRGIVLHDQQRYREVVTLVEEKWPAADRQWVELLILKANAHLAMEFEEPKLRSEGIEILARVREQDPENVNAHFLAGNALLRTYGRRDDTYASLLERATALSPGSTIVAYFYWSAAIYPHPGLGPEEKKALISAAASELVARRGQYPGDLRQVARWLAALGRRDGLGDLKAEAAALQDRVLAEFPHAVEAELMLSDRWQQLYLDLQLGQAQDTVAARVELTSMLWSFIDRPHHHEAALLGQAYYDLFRHLRRDAAVSPDTLLLLAGGAMEHHRSLPHAELAIGLAERGVHLDAARQFAQDGIDAAEGYAVRLVDLSLTTAATAAVRLDADLASVYAAIGYVELQAGDLAAARDAMDRALELRPNWPDIQFRTGALAEAEGDVEAAEIHYAWGERYERLDTYSDDRPNREALERLLMERGGTMAGYEAFLASILERDRDRRWQRVADARISEPRDLPAIELEWLAGGRIAAEELKGRIVVINFWGVWCAPCVAEAPQLQQFHEKYRDDPGVVFLTVNNDADLGMVRTWMAEKKYDYAILLDDNFAAPHGIRSYPTTWFVDANGRIAFEHRGISTAVFEEFVWRVEMLRAEAGATAAGVAAEPPAHLESAIARVRSLYFGRDFHHGAAEGDAALERWPASSELAAWTVANLARSRTMPALSAYSSARAEEAVARAESLVASRPDDVWGAIALALALSYHNDRRGEALEASLRPLDLAPTLPEAVWVRGEVLHEHRQYRAVAALIEEKWPVVDRQWAELLTLKGNAYLRFEDGPERRAEGLEILARAREVDPENVNAHYLAGSALLWDRRVEEAAALLGRAAALSPGSPHIVTFGWRAIQDDPRLDAEEKKKLISASASQLLERRGQYPSTLRQVATQLGLWGLTAEAAELQDRVLTEFDHTVEAEWVLANRWERLSLRLLQGQVGDTVSAGAELSSMLWSFLDRSRHHQAELLGNAYRRLFSHLQRDETVSPDTLLLLARGAAEHNRFLPHAELAFGLAERGVHLDAARAIARDGIDAAEENISGRLEMYETPGNAADALDRALANVHSAIGYVDLRAGDLVAAREAIDRALELKPDNPQVQLRAGALAEAEGDVGAAEIHYAWGERSERLDPYADKANREALERIHTERHGSMEGYEAFIAGIMERDRDRRWQRVADSRIAEPRDLPAMALEWLDGGRIRAEELKGRVVVINFWGVWCGPCVAEAPQIQQFHEKYRDDPGVVFLTINVFDYNLDKVRAWMAENKYDFPVLVDDDFATRSGVRAYPTTWFADADGRIVFEHSAVSTAVFEESVWRVEMLRAEAGATAAGVAAEPNVYTVPLSYNAPGEDPRPNWWPSATRVRLAEVPAGQDLPGGAVQPARRGVIQVGPTPESWIPLLLTATVDDDGPGVFTRLYLDMNRNGDFSDDGLPAVATLDRNEKTGDLAHRFGDIELRVRFPEPERTEPFLVSFWFVQGADETAPDTIIRYTNRSWRSGSVTVNGVPALVMALDVSKDALYGPGDAWSAVEASMPEASKRVLSIDEAHSTDRLMFLQRGDDDPDLVLEFRSFALDGSAITFAVVDYEISKAEDRLADDMVVEERTRPRATTAYTWTDDLDGAMAAANASGQRVFLYFETDWCGPCKTMDEWIWTDAEVVEILRAGFIGVKLDGDIAKEHVRRYEVVGYPNILIVDPASGLRLRSVKGYQSSQQLLDFLRGEEHTP